MKEKRGKIQRIEEGKKEAKDIKLRRKPRKKEER